MCVENEGFTKTKSKILLFAQSVMWVSFYDVKSWWLYKMSKYLALEAHFLRGFIKKPPINIF